MNIIDIDADRRAARAERLPRHVRLNGRDWRLPPQLPADVFDPLIDGELDDLIAMLVELVGDLDLDDTKDIKVDDIDFKAIMGAVRRNPRMFSQLLRAARQVFEKLLGEQQWPQWIATRPGLEDYWDLGKAALRLYGVSLGEAFGLSGSSKSAGQTSNPTLPQPASTPVTSGETTTIPTSSGFAASVL